MTDTAKQEPLRFLDIGQAAAILGIEPSTFRAYRTRGVPPTPPPDVLVGPTPGWREDTIRAWKAARRGCGWRDKGKGQ